MRDVRGARLWPGKQQTFQDCSWLWTQSSPSPSLSPSAYPAAESAQSASEKTRERIRRVQGWVNTVLSRLELHELKQNYLDFMFLKLTI